MVAALGEDGLVGDHEVEHGQSVEDGYGDDGPHVQVVLPAQLGRLLLRQVVHTHLRLNKTKITLGATSRYQISQNLAIAKIFLAMMF